MYPKPRRYRQLTDLVIEKNPYHIVEIGTWDGKRACEFMALNDCYYTGFDLFEDATKDTDQKEFNIKAHQEIVPIGQFIEFVGFSKFCLIKGDTNKTLHEWKGEPFDFCFIDGGHSEETIWNDFQWARDNISKGGTIVLDDWYSPKIEGKGCNFLADEHSIAIEKYPSEDKTPEGTVHLIVARV
jgi:precorrin-6B methylase 2